MTRTLVTGMTSRTASPRAPLDAFSRLLADEVGAVRELPRMHTDVSQYDDVIVGITSPLAPSANHAIYALCVLADAVKHGNLRALVIDDPTPETTVSGCRSVLRDPERLTRAYFAKRPGFSLAVVENSDTAHKVMDALEYLADGEIPLVLWPGYEWSDNERIEQAFIHANRVVPIDFSSAVMTLADQPLIGTIVPRQEMWLREDFYGKYRAASALTYPVRPAPPGDDWISYREAWGVLEGATRISGWWTPTPAHAVRTGALFVGEGTTGERLNIAPAEALEHITREDRDARAHDQHMKFEEVSWNSSTLSARLNGVLGRSSK